MEPITMDFHISVIPLEPVNTDDGRVELRVAVVNTNNNKWAANKALVPGSDFNKSTQTYFFMTVLGGSRIDKNEALFLWPELKDKYGEDNYLSM